MRWSVVLALAISWQVAAGELVVEVRDARGRPAANAVVTVSARAPSREGGAGPATAEVAAPAASSRIIDQRDEMFLPYVEVFRPGDNVVFRNSDRTRHHVYSFSPTRSFEFVLAPGESSEPMTLGKQGIVSVGCNIHDPMITYLFVSDALFVRRTGKTGNVRIPNVAAGAYAVRVWHPQLRPGAVPVTKTVAVTGPESSDRVRFGLALLPDPRLPADRERVDY